MLVTTDLKVNIDLEHLTLGEMIDIEDIAGVPMGDLGSGAALSAKAMLAMVYVTLRRDHPDVTLDDVKGLDVSLLSADTDDDEVPVVPGKEAVGSKSTSKKD